MDDRPKSEPVVDTAGNTSGHHHADCKSVARSANRKSAPISPTLVLTVSQVTTTEDLCVAEGEDEQSGECAAAW